MLTSVLQGTSKKVSDLEPVSSVESSEISHYWSSDVDASFTPMGSSTKSVNSTMAEEDTTLYISFKECEAAALSCIDSGNWVSFTRIILRCPSLYSLRLGVLYAAKLKWFESLRKFLLAIQTSYSPIDKSDDLREHILYREYFRQEKANFYSSLTSETFLEEFALLKAAADGSAQAVRILVEFISPDFGDMFKKPFLHYIYMNKDKESRTKLPPSRTPEY